MLAGLFDEDEEDDMLADIDFEKELINEPIEEPFMKEEPIIDDILDEGADFDLDDMLG